MLYKYRTQTVNLVLSAFSQAVTSRARSAVGQASRSVCRALTPPLCSEVAAASPSVAGVSTVRTESAMVKKLYFPTLAFDFSWLALYFKRLVLPIFNVYIMHRVS